MKFRRSVAALFALALATTVLTPADAAVAQKFTFKLGGECAEDALNGRIEEDVTNGCYWTVTASPAKPLRLVNLQVKGEDGTWQFASDEGSKVEKRFNSKTMQLPVPLYDEDGIFIADGTYEYRIYLKGAAASGKALVSKVFKIEYVSAGNSMADETTEEG